jgi:hypothetical protein
MRQNQNQWFLGCGSHASMGIAPEWTRNGAREAHGRRRTALRRCLERAAPCRKRMVDLSPLALPTRLLTGCCRIHVSMPSRFWRGNASVWPHCRAHRRQASTRCTKHARYIDLRRRWSHGYWYVHSAAMGSCRIGTGSCARSHNARGKGSRRRRSIHCARRKMAPFERVGARHQRRRTRPSSLSSAVADLSRSSERRRRSQGVDFDEFVKQRRALEGQSRVFVDHAGEILVWSRSARQM